MHKLLVVTASEPVEDSRLTYSGPTQETCIDGDRKAVSPLEVVLQSGSGGFIRRLQKRFG